MRRYTMRLTWPDSDRLDDYVLRCDGKDVGRCYVMIAAAGRRVWLWTVYGSSSGGMEETLEEAQRRFKDAYERQKFSL